MFVFSAVKHESVVYYNVPHSVTMSPQCDISDATCHLFYYNDCLFVVSVRCRVYHITVVFPHSMMLCM